MPLHVDPPCAGFCGCRAGGDDCGVYGEPDREAECVDTGDVGGRARAHRDSPDRPDVGGQLRAHGNGRDHSDVGGQHRRSRTDAHPDRIGHGATDSTSPSGVSSGGPVHRGRRPPRPEGEARPGQGGRRRDRTQGRDCQGDRIGRHQVHPDGAARRARYGPADLRGTDLGCLGVSHGCVARSHAGRQRRARRSGTRHTGNPHRHTGAAAARRGRRSVVPRPGKRRRLLPLRAVRAGRDLHLGPLQRLRGVLPAADRRDTADPAAEVSDSRPGRRAIPVRGRGDPRHRPPTADARPGGRFQHPRPRAGSCSARSSDW